MALAYVPRELRSTRTGPRFLFLIYNITEIKARTLLERRI